MLIEIAYGFLFRSTQTKATTDKMIAREWLHANHKRLVTVKFGPESAIYTVDRKGQKLRTFSLKSIDGMNVEKTAVSCRYNCSCEEPILMFHFCRRMAHANIIMFCCENKMIMIWYWNLNRYHRRANS